MTNARTRLQQGIRALRAWVAPIDDHLAAEVLPTNLLPLFQAMRPGERQHSLNVLATLKSRGETDPVLWQAALLHDCGKIRAPYWLWERVLVVLVKAIAPRQVTTWGSRSPKGWARPFVVNAQHAEWGADLAANAGADLLLTALIRYHQISIREAAGKVTADLPNMTADRFISLLQALQAADDLN